MTLNVEWSGVRSVSASCRKVRIENESAQRAAMARSLARFSKKPIISILK
jgi:hypothetical protein